MLTPQQIEYLVLRGYSCFSIAKLDGRMRQRIHQIYKALPKNEKRIFRRDNNKCQLCFSKDNLDIHNIDGNEKNTSPKNLITLCSDCIKKVNNF